MLGLGKGWFESGLCGLGVGVFASACRLAEMPSATEAEEDATEASSETYVSDSDCACACKFLTLGA